MCSDHGGSSHAFEKVFCQSSGASKAAEYAVISASIEGCISVNCDSGLAEDLDRNRLEMSPGTLENVDLSRLEILPSTSLLALATVLSSEVGVGSGGGRAGVDLNGVPDR